MGIELKYALNQEKVNIQYFLDNYEYGKELEDLNVYHPSMLKNMEVDLVIVSVLGDHYKGIVDELQQYNHQIKYLSRKELE